jgi:hypothetical protein
MGRFFLLLDCIPEALVPELGVRKWASPAISQDSVCPSPFRAVIYAFVVIAWALTPHRLWQY